MDESSPPGDPAPAASDPAADVAIPSAGGRFIEDLAVTIRDTEAELGVPGPHVDTMFVAYLRMLSRFGVFQFGPITIDVGMAETLLRRHAPPASARDLPEEETRFQEFWRRVREEQRRSGRPRIDELHVLLALMKVSGGLPRRVFGELGVRPEAVEAYARQRARGAAENLERLFSPEEAAAYLGVHVQTVRAWIRSGRLPAGRLAGQRALRIRASDLAGLLEPVDLRELR